MMSEANADRPSASESGGDGVRGRSPRAEQSEANADRPSASESGGDGVRGRSPRAGMSDVTNGDAEFPEPELTDSFDDFADSPFDAEPPAASDGGGGPQIGPQPGATRWYRSEERVISGVAGGLAESTALDPVLVRLGFVGLTLLDGFGIFAYLGAFVMMSTRRGAPVRRGLMRIAGLAVLGIGAIALTMRLWGGDPGSGVFILALIGVATALWHPRRRGQGPPSSGSGGSTWPIGWAPPDPSTAPQATRPIVVLPPPEPREPRPKRPRSPLGRIALAAALAAIAIGASAGEGTPRSMKIAFTVAAVICGVGLLIGAFIGRARWLIIPGLLATGGAVMAQAVEGLGVHFSVAGRNDDYRIIEDTSQLRDVNIGSGSHHVDIYKLTADGSLAAKVGVGGLYVGVPAKARVTLTSRVGIGSISTPQSSDDGYRRTVTQTFGPEGGPKLQLNLTAGIGSINVYTIASEEPFRPVEPPVIVDSFTVGTDGEILALPALPPGVAQVDEQGGLIYHTGAYQYPDGSLSLPDGTTIEADRTLHMGPGATVRADGRVQLGDGTVISPAEGIVQLPDGTIVFIRPPTETRPPGAPPIITIAPVVTALPIQPAPPDPNNSAWNTVVTAAPIQPLVTDQTGATP